MTLTQLYNSSVEHVEHVCILLIPVPKFTLLLLNHTIQVQKFTFVYNRIFFPFNIFLDCVRYEPNTVALNPQAWRFNMPLRNFMFKVQIRTTQFLVPKFYTYLTAIHFLSL